MRKWKLIHLSDIFNVVCAQSKCEFYSLEFNWCGFVDNELTYMLVSVSVYS